MRKITLKEKDPQLAQQLVDHNLAETLACSSKEKVEWQCEHGHKWFATPHNRVNKGYGCPYCSGRLAIPGKNDLQTTNPEMASQLVDQTLTTQLLSTSHKKVEWKCEHGHTWEATVATRVSKKSGCPYCSGRKAWPGESDLATLRPDLASQLVDKSLATQLRPGTNKKVEWKCEQGHKWFASPNSRTHMKSGCPYCAGKRPIVGQTDLATKAPAIAETLVDKKLATQLSEFSNKKVQFKCENGHTWSALLSNRTQFGYGCPICNANSFASKKEQAVAAYIQSLIPNEDIKTNIRTLLTHNQEIDIVLENRQRAFEFNGLYWHSSRVGTPSTLHFDKTKRLEENGYLLTHIWEDEWDQKQEATKHEIREALGINNHQPIPSTLTCAILDNQTFHDFMTNLTTQKYPDATPIALLDEDAKIVAAMSVNINNQMATIETYASPKFDYTAIIKMMAYVQTITPTNAPIKKWRYILRNDKKACEIQVFVNAGFTVSKEIGPRTYAIEDNYNTRRLLKPNESIDEDATLLYDSGATIMERNPIASF